MNGAILLCAAAVVLPIAAWEARRKWRDFRRLHDLHGTPWGDAASVLNGHPVRALRANPSVERIEPGKDGNGGMLVLTTPDGVDASWIAERIAAHPFTPGPVWIGMDVARGDDRCGGHGNDSYSAPDHSASGTCSDISSGGGE